MRKVPYFLLGVFIILHVGIIVTSLYSQRSFPLFEPGGYGIIGLAILPQPGVSIDHPLNSTYFFSVSDYIADTMSLDLNVSSVSFQPDTWWYEHEDLRHGVVQSSVGFVPNTTIPVVRWGNRLRVFALNSTTGIERNASVEFFVHVNNSAPLFDKIEDEILICENSGLFVGTSAYTFNASDIDEDSLTFGFAPNPSSPFFLQPVSEIIQPYLTVASAEIFSGQLGKVHAGLNGWTTYVRTVSVRDGGNPEYSDSKDINLTVLEVNNPPVFGSLNQSFALNESSTLLLFEVLVDDLEDGNQQGGNLSFSTNFTLGTPLFNVSQFGVVNFSYDPSLEGLYEFEVCVHDRGLDITHVNVTDVCGFRSIANRSVCADFNLSITRENVVINTPGGGGGGGGGGGSVVCTEAWTCEDWSQCSLVNEELDAGLDEDVYLATLATCVGNEWGEDCGFQRRGCFDVNNCSTTRSEPNTTQACLYSIAPSCSDGIKNCHDGACEFLVDCGGPCGVCPTCSDLLQNQGEHGVDCGGPCPRECRTELPALTSSRTIYYVSGGIGGVLIIILLLKLRGFFALRRAARITGRSG